MSGSPLASELALPFRVTVDPRALPPWSGPALATGATFLVEMITLLGALFTRAIVDDELRDIVAGAIDGKGRVTLVAPDRTAALPAGLVVMSNYT